jgi:hypothetical protein
MALDLKVYFARVKARATQLEQQFPDGSVPLMFLSDESVGEDRGVKVDTFMRALPRLAAECLTPCGRPVQHRIATPEEIAADARLQEERASIIMAAQGVNSNAIKFARS